MNAGSTKWETWDGPATSWWLDGEHEEAVTVQSGDQCLFEELSHGGRVLREVRARVLQ